MTTKYSKLTAPELDRSLIAEWSNVQRSDPAFSSPFLSPQFTLAVADVRDDVFVTVIENDGKPVGFFPHQADGHRALPVGGRLNDCHAVIASDKAQWSPRDLVAASGLSLWDFNHLIDSQTQFRPHAHTTAVSPLINLAKGTDAYLEDRRAAGSKRVAQFQRKWRKLLREKGGESEVRFVPRSDDKSALERVIQWKLDQCLRTGSYPYFNETWTVDLVHRLHQTEEADFFGALSVLFVGDTVAAAHFGMASDRWWHWWFPTYSNDWSAYSPGGLMLLKLCEHVGSEDATQDTIDLGKGDDVYKSSFANGEYGLLEGHVANRSAYAVYRSAKRVSRAWARQTPVLEPVRQVRKRLRERPNQA